MIQRRAAPATGTKKKLTTVFRVVKPAVGGVKLTPPSSSPKLPDGYRFAILALTVKLWLAVLCARRKNASAFSALLVVKELPPEGKPTERP